jgi:hypothetical protein
MSDVMFVEEIGSAISLERFATYTSEMRERCDTFVDRTSEDEVVWEPIVCGSQRPSRIGGPGEVVSHSGLEHWGFPVDVITRGSGGSSGSAVIETCGTTIASLN